MKKVLAFISACAVIAGIIVLPSCSNNNSNHTPPPPISVAITNKITSIAAGAAAVTLNATTTDPANKGVTWTISACTQCGTLSGNTSTSVKYTPPGSVPNSPNNMPTITATSVSDGTKSDTDPFTIINGAGLTVSITNPIANIDAGASPVTINATVTPTPNNGVDWSLHNGGASGPTCDPTCGVLTNATSASVTYTPPAFPPASPNNSVTLVAASADDNAKLSSDTFTIDPATNNNNAELNGQYAFLISGFDDATGQHFAYVGSFTANGTGGITGGIEDVNLPNGLHSGLAIQGSYVLATDQRGLTSIASSLGANTFAFSVGAVQDGVATKLHIIEFDDNNGTSGRRGSGVAYLQSSAAFSLASINGPYAFELVGQNSTVGSRAILIGSFTANGTTGNISGTADLNNAGVVSTGNAFTGTIASGAATGTSGRITFAIAGTNQVGYIVSASQILGMSTTDVTTVGIVSGQILQQTSSAFTNAALNGTTILYSSGLSTVAGSSFVQAGLMTFTSNTGSGTASLDTNDGGTASTLTGNFTYTVAADGNVTFNVSAPASPDLFLIDNNKAFFMDTTSEVNAGMIVPQSAGPFSNASINGNYFLGLAEYPVTTFDSTVSGIATSSGNGTLSETTDESDKGGLPTAGLTQSFTLTVAGTGRVTEPGGNIFYIISPTQVVNINSTGQNATVIIIEQ